jgi:hypothetical protein
MARTPRRGVRAVLSVLYGLALLFGLSGGPAHTAYPDAPRAVLANDQIKVFQVPFRRP